MPTKVITINFPVPSTENLSHVPELLNVDICVPDESREYRQTSGGGETIGKCLTSRPVSASPHWREWHLEGSVNCRTCEGRQVTMQTPGFQTLARPALNLEAQQT